MTETNEIKTIGAKLARVQAATKAQAKAGKNAYQKYDYYTEGQLMELVKEELKKEGLAMAISDVLGTFNHEIASKEHAVWGTKEAKINDGENGNEPLTFNFLAMGQDGDIAKAKGKADTYGTKYFLQKFFLIPAKDGLDPDQEPAKRVLTEQEKADEEKQIAEIKAANSGPDGQAMTAEQKKQINEFLKKHGFSFNRYGGLKDGSGENEGNDNNNNK